VPGTLDLTPIPDTLFEKGLIQFAKEAGGGYDPFWFDMARETILSPPGE